MTSLLIGGLGTPELILILLVLVLLFGASKLPELARGSGRALRIFKAETKGLIDGDDDEAETKPPAQRTAELANKQAELDAKQAELDAERERLQRGEL
ncbi:twin-arginine translocase TatA/TatE family subunit [Nocardioides sp. CER19]|uniref:twin-arginine translocase TatA/TatE family subunit n=1 Tax=Nocardioides sp. CER19 TaxID=3038538 RepID=UPI00244AF0CD|nr:twin-arginine translocase TatA/TatE family subunit [Nocardioides sp. CER19]MDH2415664.1 twin-arginine translocase TatA/TatE family subunit [Nocardioides sp. CER19]